MLVRTDCKGVLIDNLLDFGSDLIAFAAKSGELFGQPWQDECVRVGAGDHDCLSPECGDDLATPGAPFSGAFLRSSVSEPLLASSSHGGG